MAFNGRGSPNLGAGRTSTSPRRHHGTRSAPNRITARSRGREIQKTKTKSRRKARFNPTHQNHQNPGKTLPEQARQQSRLRRTADRETSGLLLLARGSKTKSDSPTREPARVAKLINGSDRGWDGDGSLTEIRARRRARAGGRRVDCSAARAGGGGRWLRPSTQGLGLGAPPFIRRRASVSQSPRPPARFRLTCPLPTCLCAACAVPPTAERTCTEQKSGNARNPGAYVKKRQTKKLSIVPHIIIPQLV